MFRVEPRGAPKSFMTSTADDYGPQFSPDGKKVLFLSSRSGGSREVFTANADGSNPVQLTKDAMRRSQAGPLMDDGSCSSPTANQIGIYT